jgi:hypothetical protein
MCAYKLNYTPITVRNSVEEELHLGVREEEGFNATEFTRR